MSSRPPKNSGTDRPRVARYWPGRAPTAQPDESTESESESDNSNDEEVAAVSRRPVGQNIKVEVHAIEAKSIAASEDRARLVRARRQQQQQEEGEDKETKVISKEEEKESEGDDDEAAQARRRQVLRQRLLQRRREEQEQQIHIEKEEEEEEDKEVKHEEAEAESEYTTEYETDEESEEEIVLLKPVFIPKSKRQTIAEKEQLAQEMAEAEAKREQERMERHKAAHQMVANIIKREIEASEKETNRLDDVDDTDGLDPKSELEAWKLRELKRIQRDHEEQIKREEENKEIERRRAMTDAEILREDAEKLKAEREKKQNHQFTFLQKYYHKGAFYQEDSGALMKRDYTAPTPDMPNVQLLPEVMQVRDFGKRSQTKWKHLIAEDTSSRDAGWSQKSDTNQRMQKRMGGLKGTTDYPTGKKRRT